MLGIVEGRVALKAMSMSVARLFSSLFREVRVRVD